MMPVVFAVAHRDLASGPFRHARRVGNLHAAVAELREESRHRVVRVEQAALVENAGRDTGERLGVRKHAEKALRRCRLARLEAQHSTGLEMDDLAPPRNERHQVRHPLIVGVLPHRRADLA